MANGDPQNQPSVQAAADALAAYLSANACDGSTALADLTGVFQAQDGTLTVDSKFGPLTAAALTTYNEPPFSPCHYGGGQPAPQPQPPVPAPQPQPAPQPAPIVPAPAPNVVVSTTTAPNYTTPILLGAAVIAAGIIGWSILKKKNRGRR